MEKTTLGELVKRTPKPRIRFRFQFVGEDRPRWMPVVHLLPVPGGVFMKMDDGVYELTGIMGLDAPMRQDNESGAWRVDVWDPGFKAYANGLINRLRDSAPKPAEDVAAEKRKRLAEYLAAWEGARLRRYPERPPFGDPDLPPSG